MVELKDFLNKKIFFLDSSITPQTLRTNLLNTLLIIWRRRMIGIFGSLIWSKILMQVIYNTCGEFWWSPEGPVSQIHSPHLHVDAPGIFSDLLRSVQMLKESGWGKQREATAPIQSPVKLQPWLLPLRWKTFLWAELQPWRLDLQWRTSPWAEHSDDDDDNTQSVQFKRFVIIYFYIMFRTSGVVRNGSWCIEIMMLQRAAKEFIPARPTVYVAMLSANLS